MATTLKTCLLCRIGTHLEIKMENVKVTLRIGAAEMARLTASTTGKVHEALGYLIAHAAITNYDEVSVFADSQGNVVAVYYREAERQFVMGAIWNAPTARFTFHVSLVGGCHGL